MESILLHYVQIIYYFYNCDEPQNKIFTIHEIL